MKNKINSLIKIKALALNIISALFLVILTTACSSIKPLHTPNQSERIHSIVIHYTAENLIKTEQIFADPKSKVSAHFVVASNNIYQLVDMNKRAYHAGISFWKGRKNLNDTSIGIEVVNQAACSTGLDDKVCLEADYHPSTINNLITLLGIITAKYPNIRPTNIIGHQDIAPLRKEDPGSRFPWQYLHTKGYGAWYETDTYFEEYKNLENQPLNNEAFQQALIIYGYQPLPQKLQSYSIKAFQTHFTPWLVSGEVNQESFAAMLALLKKYNPDGYKRIKQLISPKAS